ncbi:MAG: hypothetical protein OXN17_13345 [Candidatus Poribacteria bacterium]|nr:hypothetical protein [Candidatus Poribacteria bacterium]MDE0502484.1 hypothetical protein [Candidatus Poribacteria bacterium]
MKRDRRIADFILLIAIVSWLGSLPPVVQAQIPKGAKIVFDSSRDDKAPNSEKAHFEIYVMEANGDNPQNLTNHHANDRNPSWSLDGRRIAFSTNRDGNFEVYVMNANGTSPRNLTNHKASDGSPAWSPDGRKIAFQSDRGGRFDIYVMDQDGENLRNLTNLSATEDRAPSWSRDGKRIVFESQRDKDWEIYAMDADGRNPQRLTDRRDHDREPSWSPDGGTIAFSRREKGTWNIYLMDANGGNPKNLTKNRTERVEFREPSWSPTGQSIAFKSDVERPGGVVVAWTEIFLANADGAGNPKNLTQKHQAEGRDGAPDWFNPGFTFAVSPDGKEKTLWGRLKTLVH